jgi:uncharacterized protein YlxW (UPF0749 family)
MTASVARGRRFGELLGVRGTGRLAVTGVALLLGVLVIGQLRGQAAVPGLSNLSAQELTQVVGNLNTQNEQLRNEVASLQKQQAELADRKARGATTVDQLRSDLARIQSWSGALAVSGPGVLITVSGPIGGDGVEDLLNELGNAGAEAIAVADVRVVPGVVVAGAAGGLSVENTPLDGTFEIRAIGSPQILTGTLTRTAGVIAQLGATYPGADVTVTPLDHVEIPASTRNLAPTYAKPRL